MGHTPSSRARPHLFFRNGPQPIFRRPPPALRRSPALLLQARSPHTADRGARHPAAQKQSIPSLISHVFAGAQYFAPFPNLFFLSAFVFRRFFSFLWYSSQGLSRFQEFSLKHAWPRSSL